MSVEPKPLKNHPELTPAQIQRILRFFISENPSIQGLAREAQISGQSLYDAAEGRAGPTVCRRLSPVLNRILDDFTDVLMLAGRR